MSTLVVTVGTSLFTSASWGLESPFGEIPGYTRWAGAWLEEPGRRRSASGQTDDEIGERLSRRDPDDLEHFEWRPSRARRYSAEVTTLLRWMQNQGGDDLKAFLTSRYRTIDWVCPVDPEDPARIAAEYLVEVCRRKLGIAAARLRPVLTSPSILDRLRHFRDYLQGLPAGEGVDLVVSGGYKVYSMFASAFAASADRRERWKVIYVYEEGGHELVVQGAEEGQVKLAVEGRSLELWVPSTTIDP